MVQIGDVWKAAGVHYARMQTTRSTWHTSGIAQNVYTRRVKSEARTQGECGKSLSRALNG